MQKNMSGSLNGVIDEMLSGSVAGNIKFESAGGGSNVTITPTLTEGTKIADYTINDSEGVLYAPTPTEYEAGDNISIDNGVISATDTTYTAGDGITIENGVISADNISSSGILYGYNQPLQSLGVDGNIYVQLNPKITKGRYFKFEIWANRNGVAITQLSTLNLTDGNNVLNWSSNATATVNTDVASGEGPMQILDGNTSTKICTQNHIPTTDNPIIITIDNVDDIDIETYNQYNWYTANDSSDRDPISFGLSISNDGVNWSLVNKELNYNTPTSRRTLAYTGQLYPVNIVIAKYFKSNGEWIDL